MARRTLVTEHNIARARAQAQRLDAPSAETPDCLVRWLGAVQAQDYALGKWSIGQRVANVRERDIEAAIALGTILRTHVLRPTWHFVARDDLRWMLQLTGPRVLARMKPYDRLNGVDDKLVAASTKAMVKAISKDGHLTRARVAAALTRAGIPADSGWMVGHLLMHAELRAVICSGVPHGRQQTYALVDDRAPEPVSLSGESALAELTRRYFQSHSPATAQDFRWWSGLSAAAVTRGIEMLGRSIERTRIGDVTWLAVPGAVPLASSRRGSVAHLLQPYDELIVAYRETRHVIDVRGVLARQGREGLLTRLVVVDGQVVGRWQRAITGKSLAIAVSLSAPVNARGVAAITRAAARFALFVDRPSTLEIDATGG